MELTINLYKSEIMHEVQNETYLAGKSRFNGTNNDQIYNMQASDEEAHNNKLLRSMQANIESLKTNLSYYLKDSTGMIANNIQSTIVGDDDKVVLSLEVTERFNKSYTQTIAELAHKYIANMMIFEWYNATSPGEAKTFFELASNNIKEIKASFFKQPPKRPIHKPTV
ncbi:MAG: hypothetical protein RRY36_09380 [Bacteroidaceae bacterium]